MKIVMVLLMFSSLKTFALERQLDLVLAPLTANFDYHGDLGCYLKDNNDNVLMTDAEDAKGGALVRLNGERLILPVQGKAIFKLAPKVGKMLTIRFGLNKRQLVLELKAITVPPKNLQHEEEAVFESTAFILIGKQKKTYGNLKYSCEGYF